MNITPITSFSTTYKGSLKIPNSASITHKEKLDNIEALKLANVFEEFEKNLRTTMETFIYMIKF